MIIKLHKIIEFLKSKLFEQKKYIYLSLKAENFKYSAVKKDDKLKVFLADLNYKKAIEKDLYPYFVKEKQEYFKQFLNFDREDVLCYLCEKDNKIVHYFLVHTDLKQSPLRKTRFKKIINSYSDYAYLGNAFTVPEERGGWIFLLVLSRIIKDLKDLYGFNRMVLIFHEDTKGAVKFYQRLGFEIINF
tara:strand:+ start:2970 stop:3533 length:564 start_codon:yes stop_codon:yes gene_type:complete